MDTGVVPWSGSSTYKGTAVALVVVLTFLAASPFIGDAGSERLPLTSLALIGALEGSFLLIVWWYAVRPGWPRLASLGARWPGLAWVLALPALVTAASIASASLYVALVDLVGLQSLQPPAVPDALLQLQGFSGAVTAFLVVVWGPLAEEVFFRGFLFQGLVPVLGAGGAAAASAALFAASHGAVGLLVPTFATGLLLTWLFARTRSLAPCFLAHALQNSIVLMMGPLR